jgi:hypothetical protein
VTAEEHVPPRAVLKRRRPGGAGRRVRLRGLGATAALAVLLAGCTSERSSDPYAEGIPEARASASASLDAAVARIVLPDGAVVLGEGREDGCGVDMSEGFFPEVTQYYCTLGWRVAFVLPGAASREEVAGTVDAQMRSTDLDYEFTLAESLVTTYPSQRDWVTMTGGGLADGVEISVEAEPFRADAWRPPIIPGGSAVISADGDLGEITASDVAATGATEVITILASTRYWDTKGIDPPRTRSATFGLEYFGEGPVYAFDIALPVPVDRGVACAQDPAVDPATVSSVDAPFPRLTFALRADGTSDDMQRLRDCLTAGLTSGSVAVITPHDPDQ